MEKLKLSEWAKRHGVCYRTAYNYYRQGKFKDKHETNSKGSIWVFEEEPSKTLDEIFNEFKSTILKKINEK